MVVNSGIVITNLDNSYSYTIPIGVKSLQLTKEVSTTTMPIPLQDSPILLNFGGAKIDIVIMFTITDTTATYGVSPTSIGDLNWLYSNFASASVVSGYSIVIPQWGVDFNPVNGFVTNFQVTMAGGQANTIDVQMNFTIGTPG